ncbi:hypothetical protein TNCV_3822811 [Trichonephila clavipes]|nr:hypothetical protein TNCV_3822811 [Trichonephila clavipes]
METAVNCMTLFNLNSNLYPTGVIVVKIFGEKIAVCADTGASHTIAEDIKRYNTQFIRTDESKNLSPKQARKINVLRDRNEACFQPGGEHTPFIEHRFDTGDQPPIATYPYRMNPVKKQDCQKENFDRRRSKYYKPGDKVWVTIHPISRNNRSRKFMPKREGPYLILTLRSPVTHMRLPTRPTQTKPLELIMFLP